MWNEIRRKFFHLTGLLYVLGVVYVPRSTYIAVLTTLMVLVLSVEQARLKIPSVGLWFQRRAGALFRESEQHKMSGVFWMVDGVWITVVLLKSIPLAVAALLYLLLGDTVASLVGQRLRGPKWPRSPKSVSGSSACFFMCMFIGIALLRPHYYGWAGIFAGAAVATVAEAMSGRLNDNMTIPVAAALTFLVCYGL